MGYFYFSTTANDSTVCLNAAPGHCSLNFGGTLVDFIKPIISFAVGNEYAVAVCADNPNAAAAPEDVMVYDLQGNYLWNIGDMVNKNTHPSFKSWFVCVVVHTKKTLTQQPSWRTLFGSCTLYDDHEYFTAYDGGNQWLFDITDRKLVKRVFTH